ncbi:MAG: hypothetical protein HC855_02080 [Rhizobiales bacterium]|nr:hypothetical protein [Hyphomicrobiales bacterium]
MMVDGGVSLRSVFDGFDLVRTGLVRAAKLDFGGPRITGVRLPLQSLMRGNAAKAIEYYRGVFSWTGVSPECMPGDIFLLRAPSKEWAAKLHRFDWLHDLSASGQALHRTLARRMVLGWAETAPTRQSMIPGILDRRIINLLFHASYLISNASDDFRAALFRALSRDVAKLRRSNPRNRNDQFNRAIALFAASISLRGCEPLREQASAALRESLANTILPDGGHVSRNPAALLNAALDLVPLVRALQSAHEPVLANAAQTVERIYPMLRMLRHGDGGLAHFQGAGYLRSAELEQLLSCDTSLGKPLNQASYSGYCRTSQGQSALILDAGSGPACDSPLAFEFSIGAFRIFTSCATPEEAPEAWRQAASRLAAHNTAELPSLRRLERQVSAEVIPSPRGVLIRGSNGAASGPRHNRDLFLASNGEDLRGEESFSETANREILIRFHLHPSIRASQARNGNEAWLLLPNRSAWRFFVKGGEVSFEESVYLADPSGPRKTSQLVIRAEAPGATPVKWALRRIDKQPRHNAADNERPELPF